MNCADLWLKARTLMFRRRVERELREELTFHVEMQTRKNLQTGMTPDEAKRQALIKFGPGVVVEEQCRDIRGVNLIDDTRNDVRYALQMFAKNPTFTLIVVLTLALGIGANTAIFTVVNSLLLKPLPFKDSDRLVRLVMNVPAAQSPTGVPQHLTAGLSPSDVAELQTRTRTLSSVATVGTVLMGFSGHEDAARLQGSRVSSTIFPMLDARPIIGRVFGPDDERPGADAVILLSYTAWQRFFAGAPDILNRVVTLDSVFGPRTQSRYSIVGVMPSGFEFPTNQTMFWMPFQIAVPGRGDHSRSDVGATRG